MHRNITHFELRPLDPYGRQWQISYRDKFTTPPNYSGGTRGTLQDVVFQALERAEEIAPLTTTKTMRRRIT